MVSAPKKQNPFSLWLPIAGAIGAGLRLWYHHTAVDYKGLLTTGHPGDRLSYLVFVAGLLALLFWSMSVTRTPSCKKLLPATPFAFLGCLVGGAGILATDVFEVVQLKDTVSLLCVMVGLVAAGCLVYTGWCRMQGKIPHLRCRSVITVYFIVHLVSQYRLWSAESQIAMYFFPALASVALMVTSYARAALENGKKNGAQFGFLTGATVLLCCLSVAVDGGLFYLTMAIWLLADMADFSVMPRKSRHTPMELPKSVRYCMETLEKAGYQAYVVGGCVRDALLGKQPHDYDLCTDALPQAIAELFEKHELIRNGEKHGTIGVIINKEVFEITTFRTEGGYEDNRHPDWVEFVQDVEDDLARRDFTVNAMAYNPKEGYVDPWGGQQDLADGVIRAVGDPDTRFTEDPLRILRGMRFAVRFGFWIAEPTKQAMFRQAPLMDNLARERVFTELCQFLPHASYEDILDYEPLLTQIIPELKPSVDFQQHSPHHAFDVFTHIAHVTGNAPATVTLRWAALLHDTGKPHTFTQDETGRGHFYGHAKTSAEIAETVMHRLKAPTALLEDVVWLVQNHMIPYELDVKQLRKRMGRYGIARCQALLSLQRADFCNKGTGADSAYFDELQRLMDELAKEDTCFTVRDLAVSGNDLITLGFTPGPQLGQALSMLLGCVQDEILENNRDALLEAAKKMLLEDAQ